MPQLPVITVVTPWLAFAAMSGEANSARSSCVCTSIKPGATIRPETSISRAPCAFDACPTAEIRSPATATSARKRGAPVPSITVPPRRIQSVIAKPHFGSTGIADIVRQASGFRGRREARCRRSHGIAAEAEMNLESPIERLRVELAARAYDILVGPGLIARAGAEIRPLMRHRQAVIVTDEIVARHHLTALELSLSGAGITHRTVVLPPGEGTKDLAHFGRLVDDILACNIERGTMLVALGGGVVGDIAGFAAATLLRGIDFVQIPTTLLAQVDSSVGGKTAINTSAGKNLLGAFYQPRLVLADTASLATLPRRELRAGYAEIVKYGLIRDAAFFDWLEANGDAGCDLEPAALTHAITASCRMKAAIVANDEREAGDRELLNFRHTFGHALEAETGFGDRLLHGEAGGLGLVHAVGF